MVMKVTPTTTAREERTWKTLAIAACGVAALTAGLVVYKGWDVKERVDNLPPVISNTKFQISDRSKDALVEYMREEPLIVGVAAVEVDLAKNTRRTVFFQASLSALQRVWDDYLTRRAPPPAVFSASSPAQQNERMAHVINGNFDCRPFRDTVGFKYYPEAENFAPWICSISVPPGFTGGDFSGFITFYLTREPEDAEMKKMTKNAIELSALIHRRDIQKK
jgi:hypothetical protein